MWLENHFQSTRRIFNVYRVVVYTNISTNNYITRRVYCAVQSAKLAKILFRYTRSVWVHQKFLAANGVMANINNFANVLLRFIPFYTYIYRYIYDFFFFSFFFLRPVRSLFAMSWMYLNKRDVIVDWSCYLVCVVAGSHLPNFMYMRTKWPWKYSNNNQRCHSFRPNTNREMWHPFVWFCSSSKSA